MPEEGGDNSPSATALKMVASTRSVPRASLKEDCAVYRRPLRVLDTRSEKSVIDVMEVPCCPAGSTEESASGSAKALLPTSPLPPPPRRRGDDPPTEERAVVARLLAAEPSLLLLLLLFAR